MSFDAVTRWALRCDGDTTRGQCAQQLVYADDPDDPDSPLTEWLPALYARPELSPDARADLRYSGWLLVRDGYMLCPRHVAGLEHLARAALEGLPFNEFDEEDPR